MKTVNMHEAKTRLSELVKAVETRNEVVVLCRNGREVAEIRRPSRRHVRTLQPDARFRVEFARGYRPAEPLADNEWPEDSEVNVLLDTCALLALARGDLPKKAAAALRSAAEASVSVVSPWEIAIEAAAGKLRLREPPMQWFLGVSERYQLRELPLDAQVACAAAALPLIHRDPFDRVLVALAQAHVLTVLTSDENIAKYQGVKTIW